MEFRKIKVEEIVENNYNPNEMPDDVYDHLVREIKRIGLVAPVIVRKQGDKYIIVDGEHRFHVAKELEFKEVPCIVTEMTEEEAKLSTINLNKIRGTNNPLKFAELLDSLSKTYSTEQMESFLNMAPQEIESYKMLMIIPDALPELMITPEILPVQDIRKDFIVAKLILTKEQVAQLKEQFPEFDAVELFRKVDYFFVPKMEAVVDGKAGKKDEGADSGNKE